jgi:hypothetical protein
MVKPNETQLVEHPYQVMFPHKRGTNIDND